MTANKVYFKYGIYRTYVSRWYSYYRKEAPGQIVYYANVKRSKTEEGLNPSIN